MQQSGVGANAMRVMRSQATDVRRVPGPAAADLLTMILLDGAAADRWLARAETDIGEARDAIARLRAHAKDLARALDDAGLGKRTCDRAIVAFPGVRSVI